jgi:hypothetical protein
MNKLQLRNIRAVINHCFNDACWMRDEDKLSDNEYAPTAKEFKEKLLSALVEIDKEFKDDF